MAMSDSGLGGAIASALQSITTITDEAALNKFANALGQAIVEYLKSNATVVGTVTSGSGAGGQVQGTVN